MKQIKEFFSSLLNKDDPNSSKRFSGLMVLFTTISLAITATIASHGICPVFIFNGLLLFAAGCFGFNMVENIMKPKEIAEPVVEPKIENENEKVDNPDSDVESK